MARLEPGPCPRFELTDHPIVSLALCAALTGDLDEALVERQVVADTVLPALALLSLQ